MTDITYVDRLTQQEEKEIVYGGVFIKLLYGKGFFSRLMGWLLLSPIAKTSFFSAAYGALQKSRLSRRKVKPFIRAFNIDPLEFVEPVEAFRSFNDFFIRKLKKEVRPLALGDDVLIMPADARYLVFPNISRADGFLVKGESFSLSELLQDDVLARRFEGGGMVIARLCPVDYHRFHFPCDTIPGEPRLINGALYSVNPTALKRNIHIMSQNKRVITELKSSVFGSILYIEVGATNVGTICQTFTPHRPYAKGEEKGYFSFGGSCLILLFEPNRVVFDPDLVQVSERKMEVRALLGQSLGKKL